MRYDEVVVGTEIAPQNFTIARFNLVMYAGASGDFNPIHWNESFAKAVGLPDVIAHGMFTMAQAGRLLTDWAGDPGAVLEYGVRFSKPVVVPNDGGSTVTVSGVVTEKLAANVVAVELTATVADEPVLLKVHAKIRLP